MQVLCYHLVGLLDLLITVDAHLIPGMDFFFILRPECLLVVYLTFKYMGEVGLITGFYQRFHPLGERWDIMVTSIILKINFKVFFQIEHHFCHFWLISPGKLYGANDESLRFVPLLFKRFFFDYGSDGLFQPHDYVVDIGSILRFGF